MTVKNDDHPPPGMVQAKVHFYDMTSHEPCDLPRSRICHPLDESIKKAFIMSVTGLFIGVGGLEAMAFRFCPFCGSDYAKWGGYLANLPAVLAAQAESPAKEKAH